MERCKGIGASQGIAIGPAYALDVGVVVSERLISRHEVDSEIARFERALAVTDGQLERLQQHLTERNRHEGHDIVEAHRLMLKSPELVGETRRLIREECLAAEWAVRRTLDDIHAAFAGPRRRILPRPQQRRRRLGRTNPSYAAEDAGAAPRRRRAERGDRRRPRDLAPGPFPAEARGADRYRHG